MILKHIVNQATKKCDQDVILLNFIFFAVIAFISYKYHSSFDF